MATNTLIDMSDLTAHVPVDKFDIVNGPGALKCIEILEMLHRHPDIYVEATFTLKTLASDSLFIRQLKLANIYRVLDGNLSFTAIFNNRIVSGAYDIKSRTGWFNLD